jgi:UPF0271 protein
MARRVDLNADVGESLGPWPMGDDASLIPLVTSVNIACGSHAGDPVTIRRTIELALDAGVAIGAHPGYPDLIGFGRRDLAMTADELEASVLFQVSALDGMVRAAGGRLGHVKAHGALYNRAARDREVADPIARAVAALDPSVRLVGPPGSKLLDAAKDAGLGSIAEAFADRAYEADGSLRSRRLPAAVHTDPAVVAAQAVSIVVDGRVRSVSGEWVSLAADTICLHGDTPAATAMASAVRTALVVAGVRIARLDA